MMYLRLLVGGTWDYEHCKVQSHTVPSHTQTPWSCRGRKKIILAFSCFRHNISTLPAPRNIMCKNWPKSLNSWSWHFNVEKFNCLAFTQDLKCKVLQFVQADYTTILLRHQFIPCDSDPKSFNPGSATFKWKLWDIFCCCAPNISCFVKLQQGIVQ